MRNPRAICASDLNAARKRMMLGASLEQAADHIVAEPSDLDIALWKNLLRFAHRGDFRRSA